MFALSCFSLWFLFIYIFVFVLRRFLPCFFTFSHTDLRIVHSPFSCLMPIFYYIFSLSASHLPSHSFQLCPSLKPVIHWRFFPLFHSLFSQTLGMQTQFFSSSSITLSPAPSISLFVSEMTLFIIHAAVDVVAVLFPSQREERTKNSLHLLLLCERTPKWAFDFVVSQSAMSSFSEMR